MPKCTWILTPCRIGVPATYCGKPIKTWTTVKDDDRMLRRQYPSICAEHQAIVDARPPGWDDEEDEEGTIG